ncbi:Brl1p NDAI_0C02180 [Naumovozyma dairenensis CBS 421]|uniref:Brl1/Brr6 domain-containing protein n=1 Tax=Naumovozyma dairenensis (strain ATCC 10597 / BCRC 20456 / CBS 421 / NBRC 0211 / NRRL Y-12639) TaxID=1071378 RepID=G0W7W7_NAUDC|nr:hypothetical protein NDAI_0C02180 [Naumovozyma dairenensis CBS 421]CCD23878.1 hypothetical protein NDAI_0C02180 [Naumovozyma dairenensis CBS 421]
MEVFSRLSLDDNDTNRTITNEDNNETTKELVGISNLSLNDSHMNMNMNTHQDIHSDINSLPPSVIKTYLPHFPNYPSPLRNTFQFYDSMGDSYEMDIDDDIEENDAQETEQESRRINGTPVATTSSSSGVQFNGNNFKVPIKKKKASVHFVEPKRNFARRNNETPHTDKENNDEEANDDDELSGAEEEEGEDEEKNNKLSNTTMLKALLSPTKLGVAAATKIDGITHLPIEEEKKRAEGDPNVSEAIEAIGNEPVPAHSSSSSMSSSFDIESTERLKEELRLRQSNGQPINVSINNHNYYYPNGEAFPLTERYPPMKHGAMSAYYNNAKYYNAQGDDDNDATDDNKYILPHPWSNNSHPIWKVSYTIISYLQILLNFITTMIIISSLIIFINSIRNDLNSIWTTRKNELEIESKICKEKYFLNRCHLHSKLPALETQCATWSDCMNRNNDIFFRARSILTAKLVGDIINSFIDPIGWKPLFVILFGLAIWCFSSNFLLGFARAKIYYGDPVKYYHHQKQQQQGQDQGQKSQEREHNQTRHSSDQPLVVRKM